MTYALRPSLWRTCRALANHQRLRIMKILDARGEMSVSQLARSIKRPLSSASEDLRILNARGLLRARRSGRYVYYSIGADASIPWTADLEHAIVTALRSGRNASTHVFKSLTSLTHNRRHSILFELHHGPLNCVGLRKRVGLSTPALQRHLRKLRSRGMVERRDHTYRLATPRDILRTTLLNLASNRP